MAADVSTIKLFAVTVTSKLVVDYCPLIVLVENVLNCGIVVTRVLAMVRMITTECSTSLRHWGLRRA